MKNIWYVLVLLLLIGSPLRAQESDTHHSKEDHSRTAVYEVITSGIYSFDPETGHGSYGMELHLTYWFNHVWGAGLGYTLLFEGEQKLVHQIALLGSYNPTSWITINAGPNFRIPDEESDLAVSAYLETEFNYRLREWVHFGPVLGAVLGKKTEINVGFHLGFEF